MLAAFGRAEAGGDIIPPNPYLFTIRQAVVQSGSGIVALGSGEVIEDTLDHTDPDRDGYVRVGFPDEEVTLSEQVLAFQRASIVIGPHGAGLTNMIFCQPGRTVLEIIALESLNHCYRSLSVACGHRYDFVVGRRVHGAGNDGLADDAWVVSVHHVLAALVHYRKVFLKRR